MVMRTMTTTKLFFFGSDFTMIGVYATVDTPHLRTRHHVAL